MTNPSEPTQQIPQEELVAYLDGELEDEAARQIEELLQSDESVRDELHRLEQAWEALGALPRSEASERLTRSTVEMAAIEAQSQLGHAVAQQTKRRFLWWGVAAVALMLAGLLGTLAASLFWPEPDQGLLRDLPVVRHLDPYQQADNLLFLRELRDKEVFTPKKNENEPSQAD